MSSRTQPQPQLLQPGHVFARVVPAGTTVFVARGSVRLEAPPQWLAERMHVPRLTLHEGQAQAVEDAGWLALHAPADGEAVQVVLVEPVPWWQWLRPRGLVGALALWERLQPRGWQAANRG